MHPFISSKLTFQVITVILYALLVSSCEGTSITISPLGTVSVCPGGQVLLTCKIISGSFLHWTVSVPHLALSRGRAISSQAALPAFMIGFTEFNITRTSESPLISQLLVNNVTTEINGSNIYCSEDDNETNARAPMIAINVIHKDDDLLSANHSLNVSLMSHLLRNNNVTVTLQWPREDGEVYHVNVWPEISLTEVIKVMDLYTITTNLTISYDTQYNVTIVSSLCGVTTTKVLNYVTCDYQSTQLLNDNVQIVMESDSPKIEGQFITYTCLSEFIQTGPNVSVCMENGKWEPDPGKVECIANCGVPHVNRYVKLNYSSTLDGSVLILACESEMSHSNTTDEQILNVTCHSNGNWIPDPAEFTCSSFTTALPDIKNGSNSASAGVILGSVLGVLIFSAMAIITAISTFLCLKKKGFLHPETVIRLPDIQLENTYHHPYCVENTTEQPDQQPQDTLVYADIGPSSFKKTAKHLVTLSPEDTDDQVEYALLNHSLQKPVVETNQDSIADGSLYLDTLLIQLRGAVTSRWYQLGAALEVDKTVLEKCSNYPPEESIVEILDQWLRTFPGRPTWRDVASALRKINLQQLANDIEMVYETGKLPIQLDNDDVQQVLSTTALELTQPEEDKTRTTYFNDRHAQDESAPPLPPKPLAGSDIPKKMSAPPRPPKYVAKS